MVGSIRRDECLPIDTRVAVSSVTFDWQIVTSGTGFGRSGAIPRPTDLLFAPDGRLFFCDDMGGAIYWIAPRSLLRPSH